MKAIPGKSCGPKAPPFAKSKDAQTKASAMTKPPLKSGVTSKKMALKKPAK